MKVFLIICFEAFFTRFFNAWIYYQVTRLKCYLKRLLQRPLSDAHKQAHSMVSRQTQRSSASNLRFFSHGHFNMLYIISRKESHCTKSTWKQEREWFWTLSVGFLVYLVGFIFLSVPNTKYILFISLLVPSSVFEAPVSTVPPLWQRSCRFFLPVSVSLLRSRCVTAQKTAAKETRFRCHMIYFDEVKERNKVLF